MRIYYVEPRKRLAIENNELIRKQYFGVVIETSNTEEAETLLSVLAKIPSLEIYTKASDWKEITAIKEDGYLIRRNIEYFILTEDFSVFVTLEGFIKKFLKESD